MNQAKTLPIFGGILLILFTLYGCQLNPIKDLNWQTDLLAPIAYSSIGIEDFVQDTTLLTVGTDNLISVVIRDSILTTNLGDLIEFPDTTVSFSVKLDTLTLNSDTITQDITLADVARQLAASGNPFGQILLNNHGNTLPLVPEITGLSSGVIDIDASQFFEFAELESGELVLSIENEFPLDIKDVYIRVANKNLPGPVIVSDTFALIPSGGSVTEAYDMSGKEIESALQGELSNLTIAAGLNVLVDTTDYVRVSLIARGLKAKTATAVFPAQTLLDTIRTTEYLFKGEFKDVQITKVKVKSGRIRAESISTVEDTIAFSYSLPTAVNNAGEIPGIILKLNPAPPGGISQQIVEQELDGFTIDLTAGGTEVNTLTEDIKINLVYSGNKITLDQTDSVFIDFGLVDLEPTYVEGYIGQQKFSYSGKQAVDVFTRLNIGKVRFSQPSFNITFANTIGVSAEVEVKDFTGLNTASGQSTRLTGSPFLPGPLPITGPQLPDTNGTAYTAIRFDTENSNIKSFVNLQVDEIQYDIEVLTNPDHIPGQLDNFGTDNSQLTAFIDFELPLDGVLESLILTDTTDLEFGEVNIEEIESFLLRIVVENQFPLEAVLTATILNASWEKITDLADNQVIEAGIVNANGFVDTPGTSQVEKTFDQALTDRIINEGKYIVFRYSISTRPAGEAVKLFADYRVNTTLVGQFNYKLNN